MKKFFVISVGAMLLLSSCGSYTGQGAYVGGSFGSMIGSAIGGISSGWRGSDVGSLIGMAGGAAVGAVVGAAADKAHQKGYEDYRATDSFGSSVSAVDLDAVASIEIRNARIIDASRDGILTRGEEARMVFEIHNNGSKTVFGVQPSVAEVTGNRHIHVSENILIESIAPGKGVRYTALIKADNSLRDGEAVIRIGVLQGQRTIDSQTKEFPIKTSKR